MPRPDKRIAPGGLDGVATPSRGRSWTKYGGIETVDGRAGIPTEITVDLTDQAAEADLPTMVVSKYAERASAAPLPPIPAEEMDLDPAEPTIDIVGEWTSVRTIDGRTYRRHDELVPGA